MYKLMNPSEDDQDLNDIVVNLQYYSYKANTLPGKT